MMQSLPRPLRHAITRFSAAVFALLLTVIGQPAAADQATCFGQFPNPITDVCWNCVLPLAIGNVPLGSYGQIDITNPSNPVCSCIRNGGAVIGVTLGFWEPARLVEVTRTPWCFPTLGGVSISPGITVPRGGQDSRTTSDTHTRPSFYQVHWYTDPLLYWLKVLNAFGPCLESGSLDIAYTTEVDPTWNDDTLAVALDPENLLFANIVAQAACTADCIAATVGFPLETLFWCAGCNGPILPLTGTVHAHVGGVQASAMLTERMIFKMHRQLLAWQYWGDAALCGPQLAPLMTKSAYKAQLIYPIPQTSTSTTGVCCEPLGRTVEMYGGGKEYPIKGEDFAYLLFRKRNCCMPYQLY